MCEIRTHPAEAKELTVLVIGLFCIAVKFIIDHVKKEKGIQLLGTLG